MATDTVSTRLDQAHSLINSSEHQKALDTLKSVLDQEPNNWNALYLTGQAHRFRGELGLAVKCLARAASLREDEPSILLALGIALQLDNKYKESIRVLARCVEVSPYYILGYNSLAMTYKRMGDLETSLDTYATAIVRNAKKLAKSMHNNIDNPVLKISDFREDAMWPKLATNAAVFLSQIHGPFDSVAFPDSAFAREEERSERHGGLLWTDYKEKNNETTRLYLPNYFNTFRKMLQDDKVYAQLVGNKGLVLEMLGQKNEAARHKSEAEAFF